jgi:hypothetical protein
VVFCKLLIHNGNLEKSELCVKLIQALHASSAQQM